MALGRNDRIIGQSGVCSNLNIPVYFFQGIDIFQKHAIMDNPKIEAKRWVVNVKNEKYWAIFKAEIETDFYFDLIENVKHKRIFSKLRDSILEQYEKEKKSVGWIPLEFSDKIVYNHIYKTMKRNNKKLDLIRAIVTADKYKGYHSYTVLRLQAQVCVKNINCIKQNSVIALGGT